MGLTYAEFERCNEELKEHFEELVEILVVDFREGWCQAVFEDGVLQTVGIRQVVEDVCCDRVCAVKNPSMLLGWGGFEW